MEDIKISVIVPVYKVPERYLRCCIESVIGQSLKEIEIILIDDGSPDDCGKICDEYAAHDDRIKVIHKENGGVSKARNIGIETSSKTAEYIAFVDSDDWVDEKYLETLYKFAIENHSDIVQCNNYYFKDNLKKERLAITEEVVSGEDIYRLRYNLITTEYSKRYSNKHYGSIRGVWGKLISMAIVLNNNIRFDEEMKIGEDTVFVLRCFNYILNIGFTNKYLYYYRINAESAMHKPRTDMFEMRLLLADKYLDLFNGDNSQSFCTGYASNILSLVYHSVSNISKFYGKYRDCAENIKEILNHGAVTKIFSMNIDKSFFSLQEKIFLFLIKIKASKLLYFIIKLKVEK